MTDQHQASQTQWLAVCAKGLESLLAEEIKQLGGVIERETHLGVYWLGSLEVAYRVCLWSRLAGRVLLPLQDSQVDSVEDMYQTAQTVDWPMLFSTSSSFRIDFHGRSSFINNTQFGAQKIKDAIVDIFRDETGSRPSVDKQGDIRIEAQLRKGRLQLYLNISGDSLHRRGYRLQPGKAPLKETLAAALLMRSRWPEKMAKGEHLLDPMCGSGTLVIEAAMMAADVAPGLSRPQWGFERWLGHNHKLWLSLVEEARQRRFDGIRNCTNRFYGSDLDAEQLNACRKNLERAGVESLVHLERRSVEDIRVQHNVEKEGGLILVNPPYGERLSELPQLAPLYQKLHDAAMKLHRWSLFVFTSNLDLAKAVRRPLAKYYKFYNGKIEARLLCFDGLDEPLASEPNTAVRGPVEAFANRLKKNIKNLSKWSKREQVSCYRLYDADIPEYAVAIDRYQDCLHVQEYVPPKSIDAKVAERRLLDVLAVLPEITEIPNENIILKRREKQSGSKQYEKQRTTTDARFDVQEGDASVWVNLRDYLDTGLFLDHRPTRLDIAKKCRELVRPRFLNLFCYTATASVHAAKSGAICTSVDMSRTYLNWGQDNFTLNKLDINQHQFIQADVIKWLAGENNQYDIIFMDPPSFSNSKRMEDVLDIQRDHQALIDQAMTRLTPNGLLIFSTNLRKFKLDEQLRENYKVDYRDERSIPFDFKRRSNIHQCFYIKNK